MVSSKNRYAVVAAILAVSILSGCADYMNRWDRVSVRSGNAPDANSAIQTIEPFPSAADNATIRFGG